MVVATGGSRSMGYFNERMREPTPAPGPMARPTEPSPTPNRMAAQALLLLRNGHTQAAIGAYRALAARFPERVTFCAQQIAAIELLLSSDEI